MEAVLALAFFVGVFFLFRSNRRGAETVRAYVYLGGIAAGASQEEANSVARGDMKDRPAHVIRAAMEAVKRDYGGKQLSMIAEANRLGMRAETPGMSTETANVEPAAETTTPEWVMPFLLYYLAWEMRIAGKGNMPDTVRALATGKTNPHQQQRLLASIQSYLSFTRKRNRLPGDYELAVREARDFLQAELRTLNSPLAVRRFIRRTHKKETGLAITEAEIETQLREISDNVRNNDEAGFKLRNLLLMDSLNEMFATWHGKRVDVFSKEMVSYFGST